MGLGLGERRSRAKLFDDAAEAHASGAFYRHDIAGLEKTQQFGHRLVGGLPQPAALWLGQDLVERRDGGADEEHTIHARCSKRLGEFTMEALCRLTQL